MQSQKNILFVYSLLFLLLLALFLAFSKKSEAYFEDMFEDSSGDAVAEESAANDTVESGSDGGSGEVAALEETAVLSGTVYTEGEFLDGDILKISVIAENISAPVLGIAFHFSYDKENLEFLKYEPGDFLEQGGDPFYLVKNFKDEGKIIFGQTLRGDDSFPVGSGKIVDLYYQISNGEDFVFTFENGVVSTIDTVRQDLSSVEWKDLNLSKNGEKNIFDYSDGSASTVTSKLSWGPKEILFTLASFFGFSALGFKLFKRFNIT